VTAWFLVVPAPCEWATANRNRQLSRYEQARLAKAWRHATWAAASQAKLPKGLARVRIVAVAHFRTIRGKPAPVRDAENLAPTLKAVVDGLGPSRTFTRNGKRYHSAGWGLIPDDSAKYVDGPYCTIGEPLPPATYANFGELHLTITVADTKPPRWHLDLIVPEGN